MWRPRRTPGESSDDEKRLTESIRAEIAKGASALEAGDWQQSMHHFDAAVRALSGEFEPSSPDSEEVARLFRGRGTARFEQSRSLLDSNRGTGVSASDFHIGIESVREAIIDFDESVRLSPDDSLSYFKRGEARLFSARCERAIKSFKRASEQLAAALADFTRTVELKPEAAGAYACRAIAYTGLRQETAANADIDKALSLGISAETLRQALQVAKSDT